MELLYNLLKTINLAFYNSLIPIILGLFLVESHYKKRFESRKSLFLISRFILLYVLVSTIYSLYKNEYLIDINRATGPYKITYWIMLFSSILLPITLLFQQLAKRYFYVIFIVFCMQIGLFFERFVIILTSFHLDGTDYLKSTDFNFFISELFLFFLQGFIISILILGVLEILKMKAINK